MTRCAPELLCAKRKQLQIVALYRCTMSNEAACDRDCQTGRHRPNTFSSTFHLSPFHSGKFSFLERAMPIEGY